MWYLFVDESSANSTIGILNHCFLGFEVSFTSFSPHFIIERSPTARSGRLDICVRVLEAAGTPFSS